ncbi:MAG: TetR/AcrR family transcriptional regulator [Bacteroidales bacterium]|jgi:AcrR family transcriptional regulator|nr:TetR/AcrR family transcriptional regulator [Bacteroidales bacterium]
MQEFENEIEKRIVEAAKQAFLEKGYLGASMRDIAKAAGVNVAMLNYYFRSKDRLFDMIFTEQLNLIIGAIMSEVIKSESLMSKLKLIISNMIDSLQKHQHLPVFVITEIHRNPDRFFAVSNFDKVYPALDYFTRQVEEEVVKENIRPIDPHLLLINIISLCIFPFLAKPLIGNVLKVSVDDFDKMKEVRKDEIFELIYNRLKK